MFFWKQSPYYSLTELVADLNRPESHDKAAAFIYGQVQKAYGYLKKKYAYLGNAELEDIFQESLMAVVSNVGAGSLKSLKSLEAYFRQVFSNKSTDYLRRKERLEKITGKIISIHSGLTIDIKDDSFELLANETEQRALSLKVLKDIQIDFPICYDLYYMRYFQKLDFEEIANRSSYKSESVVRSKMSQCKKDIKAKIKWEVSV